MDERLALAVKTANDVGGIVADEVAFLISCFDPDDSFGRLVHSAITEETPVVKANLEDIWKNSKKFKSLQMAMLSASQWRNRGDEVGAVADLICRLYVR